MNRIVRQVHLFWGLQHHLEWALPGPPRATGGPAQGYRENIAAPQTEQVSRRDCQCEALGTDFKFGKCRSLRTVTVTARRFEFEIPEFK